MRRLTKFGVAWRNYLYANLDGEFNDADDFIIRMDFIQEAQEEIVKVVLADNFDSNIIFDLKQEIEIQKAALQDMIEEFVDYCSEKLSDDEKVGMTKILQNLCEEGNDCYLSEVANDWKEWGEATHNIWEKLTLDNPLGDVCKNAFFHDKMCQLIMDEWIDCMN